MDRNIVYPSAIPLDSDLLTAERAVMVGLGMLMSGLYGSNTVAVGLPCTPTVPASMQVTVGQGGIVSLQTVDSSSFGSLTANNSPLVKMGVNLSSATFTLTAPQTTGQSINYLIEATFTETDGTPVVLPYFNAANPTQPFSGPNNSGTPQNTMRTQVVSLQLKAGAAANTGTQATPAVDVSWVGLYVIQVNFGQTSITNTSISTYPSAPFLAQFLQSHHGGVPGQAPKINLTSEVQNALPLANLPNAGMAMMSNMQVFTSSGTFTVPSGVTKVRATVVGAGAGGGGSAGAGGGGTGGGSGGRSLGLPTVTPGSQMAVTVGVGGTASTSNGAGGSGGTSSFGSISCSGGQGGFPGSSVIQAVQPNGGTATGGTWNVPGLSGGIAISLGATGVLAAPGAPAFGMGGNLFYGGGGNGGVSGGNGAGGQTGVVVIEW